MSVSQTPPTPVDESAPEPETRPLALLMTGAMLVLATGLSGLLLVKLWPF
jgi:hypothetical protein